MFSKNIVDQYAENFNKFEFLSLLKSQSDKKVNTIKCLQNFIDNLAVFMLTLGYGKKFEYHTLKGRGTKFTMDTSFLFIEKVVRLLVVQDGLWKYLFYLDPTYNKWITKSNGYEVSPKVASIMADICNQIYADYKSHRYTQTEILESLKTKYRSEMLIGNAYLGDDYYMNKLDGELLDAAKYVSAKNSKSFTELYLAHAASAKSNTPWSDYLKKIRRSYRMAKAHANANTDLFKAKLTHEDRSQIAKIRAFNQYSSKRSLAKSLWDKGEDYKNDYKKTGVTNAAFTLARAIQDRGYKVEFIKDDKEHGTSYTCYLPELDLIVDIIMPGARRYATKVFNKKYRHHTKDYKGSSVLVVECTRLMVQMVTNTIATYASKIKDSKVFIYAVYKPTKEEMRLPKFMLISNVAIANLGGISIFLDLSKLFRKIAVDRVATEAYGRLMSTDRVPLVVNDIVLSRVLSESMSTFDELVGRELNRRVLAFYHPDMARRYANVL